MTKEALEKGNEIRERIEELEKALRWIEDSERSVLLIARGCTVNETVELSPDARQVMRGMLLGEITRLKAEFAKL